MAGGQVGWELATSVVRCERPVRRLRRALHGQPGEPVLFVPHEIVICARRMRRVLELDGLCRQLLNFCVHQRLRRKGAGPHSHIIVAFVATGFEQLP